jgi:diaminopimelate epimerase
MTLQFDKYQGAGNDFVIVDNRNGEFAPTTEIVEYICDRNFGVGADGLMLLEKDEKYDFYMRYFNSDGKESTMCGNGGRCISVFARSLGLGTEEKVQFNSIDGLHEAYFLEEDGELLVKLKMIDVLEYEENESYYFINTGSPHYVAFVEDLENMDVYEEGKAIREDKRFAPGGTNVNFVELFDDEIFVRTFERGVEDETLACGTGSTAAAIAASLFLETDQNVWDVEVMGGYLQVSFEKCEDGSFKNVWLTGPAEKVFTGAIKVEA